MGKPRDGETPYVKVIRTTEGDYEILEDIAIARGFVSRDPQKKPQVAKALEDLLEVAYRCIAEHGAEFAKPARHSKARETFRAIGKRAGAFDSEKRPAHRPKGSRDRKPRKRRKA